jgi:hypothetical protein
MAVWVGALGFPALVFIVGALLRLYRRAPQKCATDVFGLFVVFDAIVAGDPDPFLRFINSDAGPHDLFWAVFLLGFIATVVWVFCILDLEQKVVRAHTSYPISRRQFPFRPWITVWSVCTALIVTHFVLFTGRVAI